MQIEIKDDEHFDIMQTIASSSLDLLKDQNGLEYIVIHNGDGTCIKTGTYEDGKMWIVKYTEDDPEVE